MNREVSKFVALLLLHFILTIVLILGSYISLSEGTPFLRAIGYVEKEVSLLLNTVLLSGAYVGGMLIAFFVSKNKFKDYVIQLIFYCVIIPFVLQIILFPATESLSYMVDEPSSILVYGYIFINYLIAQYTAPLLWVIGGREFVH